MYNRHVLHADVAFRSYRWERGNELKAREMLEMWAMVTADPANVNEPPLSTDVEDYATVEESRA